MLLLHADPLLLEMKVEQLELRLQEVEKHRLHFLPGLSSMSLEKKPQETYNHQYHHHGLLIMSR